MFYHWIFQIKVRRMALLLAVVTLNFATAGQSCGGSACIVTVPCGVADNSSAWTLVNKTIDSVVGTNLQLTHGGTNGMNIINCAGPGNACHAWAPGFGDRNGVMVIVGDIRTSFTIHSFPATASMPVGPGQTPANQCLTSLATATGAGQPQAGGNVVMEDCTAKTPLKLKYGADGSIQVLSDVPVASPLCIAAPPPPPPPPPGRPDHYFSCTQDLAGGARLPYPFCNASLSEDERLDDLIALTTCEEKAAAITSSGASIPRLGVPMMGSAEDTHGVGGGCIPANMLQPGSNSTGCPTTFPAGPGLGATFDRDLWHDIGTTIGLEARGLNNMRVGPLYFLDPDINLLRDPRWGRAQEVPGEDPYLTGEYGSRIIQGTQRSAIDPRYLQAASTMKHFQVYDYEGYQPNHDSTGIPSDAKCDGDGKHCGRGTFDASPPARDFAGYFMAGFKTVAQRGQPAAIMCAYNAIYGVPACASTANNDIARDSWGWDGFIISDCGAVMMIQGSHQYTDNFNATIKAALNQGGVDVDCSAETPPFYTRNMCTAVAGGFVAQSDVDRAARRYWRTLMRLGYFDPMEEQPLVTAVGAGQVDSAANRALAQKTAAESLVLLKNSGGGGFLPMDGDDGRHLASKTKFAFIGPLANATQDLLSAPQYHGQNTLVNSHSPLQVATRRGWNVAHAKGCNICDWVPAGYPNMPCSVGPKGDNPKPLPAPDTSGIAAAVAAAKAADVAVLFLGSDQTTEAENFDRVELTLVGAQEQLLAAVSAVQPNVVVVLIHGGPIAVESAAASTQVKAIVDAFQPGELGAVAIMDLLDGTTSPSGLMPYTTYLANYTSRDIREVDLKANQGTTYWWHTDPVLFPFGWGLSYTNFSFAWSEAPPLESSSGAGGAGGTTRTVASQNATMVVQVPAATAVNGLRDFAINHTVNVTNTGSRVSDVVALAFVVAAPGSPAETPLRKLFGFERFSAVKPGESRTAYFASSAESLGVVGVDGVRRLHPGDYTIEVGSVNQNPAVQQITLIGDAPRVVEENAWARTLAPSR